MSNSYIFTVTADRDLEEINDRIGEQNPDAADRLMDKIYETCKRLARFPGMGRRWDELNTPLRSFPVNDYLIFYRPIDGGIEVVRVVSGYRDLKAIFNIQESGENEE